MAAFWTSTLGILIVCWTLREIFKDLFQPSASGSLSSFVAKLLFQLSKHRRSLMALAGPLSIIVVITLWALLIAVGFAAIYWSSFPSEFFAAGQESAGAMQKSWIILYFSLSSLTTLASGALAPRGEWIRVLTGLESLIGISLVTASVTWIVLIYPALGRMRCLTRRALNLVKAQERTGLDIVSINAEALIAELVAVVLRTRVDFIHFPLIYYFHADTEGTALGNALIHLNDLARKAQDNNDHDRSRLSACMLQIALADTAEVLGRRFVTKVDRSNPQAVFEAVAHDHLEQSA